ncbi:MAG TPA: hypothetical protein VMF11_10515 [Candidatus Baltobacteraceae bacterium]|nr:hypothetical protein [Candidatus Baltobacteraceae bacterium]
MLVALPPHAVPIVSRFDYVQVDAERDRVYAAHTGSEALVIADGVRTMKLIATISIAVVDPNTLKVIKIIKTPQIANDHPLVFSPRLNELVVGGATLSKD